MPANDSPAVLVARFLKYNNYSETLDVFLKEAGLPPDAGTTNANDLTIEKVLEEKKIFDVSVRFEKLGTSDNQGWSTSAPAVPEIVSTLPSSSNVLFTSAEKLGDAQDDHTQYIISTSADRRLNVLNIPTLQVERQLTTLHDSPILSCAALAGRVLLTSSMSGQLILSSADGRVLDQRRDHAKYVVKIAVHHDPSDDKAWVATAGWDAKVHLYSIDLSTATPKLSAPSATQTLQTNPESLAFVLHPTTNEPILIITRRDSTFLCYHAVDDTLRLLGKQNLAPHSNAWIAFSPSSIAISPTDPTLLAVATSAVPHMKLILVRLLIPSTDADATTVPVMPDVAIPIRTSILDDTPGARNASSQAREALALQDREAAAILVHVSTLAPQTPYSTPALAWRPDGSGVWVNSDDGVIRGIEAKSGKIVATLKGHEPNSKVRCLWGGQVKWDGGKEEWLVSGGFDQKLIVWRPDKVRAA